MTSNDPVGVVTAMYLETTDVFGNDYENKINGGWLYVNPNTTYAKVDTFARKLANLSTNTYNDTKLVTEVSVNEVLAG